MNKLLFVTILSMLFPFLGNAESGLYTVVGRAVDSTSKKGIPFVTITVQDSQNKVIKRLASDSNGDFEFTIKEYSKGLVIISAIGYRTAKANFTINNSVKKSNMGDILLSEMSTSINQVVVQAQRQLIKVEPDKISYNPEADPESPTINALDMMRKVPLITIDGDDNIKLKGAENYKILINGKESPLMSSNAKDVLKGMPASSIKNIEVITNPSSKYSAEGVGGIINIVTNKANISGFSGNTSLKVDHYGSLGGSIYTTAKIGKFAFSVNYSYNQWKRPKSKNFSSIVNTIGTDFKSSITDGYSKNESTNHFASGELSYEIDSLNLISASFWGYSGSNKGNNQLLTSMFLPDNSSQNQLVKQFQNINKSSGTYGSMSGNIDYQRSYKKPDKLLTFSYKLDVNPNSSKYDREIVGLLNYPYSKSRSENRAGTYENTLQADFVNPITPKHQYEVGLKYILRTNPSNIDYYDYNSQSASWIPNSNRNNDLDYTQNIVAAYIGYLLKINKMSYKIGARLEGAYTDASYSQKSKDLSFNNNLTDVVPYATIAYNTGDASSIKLSYTQRLQRPGIWYLNPYIDDENPISASYGNPNLKTEKVNTFDLGYNRFAKGYSIDISLFARLNNNAIQTIYKTLPSGAQEQTYDNTGKSNEYGVSLYSSINPLSTLSASIYGDAMYNRFDGYTEDYSTGVPTAKFVKKNGWNTNFGGNFRWTLIKSITFSGYGGYQSARIGLFEKSKAFSYHGISLRKDFLNKKLALSLSANNPFQKIQAWERYTQSANSTSYSRNEMEVRSFRVSITYRFGKMGETVKKASRSINNDDVKGGGSKGSSNGGSN